ncbi:hypothetical protein HMI55_005116 [Coelomomyces lativittatus]|nr:hypothetical protein HMI56_007294 [Coelomomyces lativittatus]KAJ1517896.1 hypothetical protein HMI55_005116 [Coelomomyces lativittatus]
MNDPVFFKGVALASNSNSNSNSSSSSSSSTTTTNSTGWTSPFLQKKKKTSNPVLRIQPLDVLLIRFPLLLPSTKCHTPLDRSSSSSSSSLTLACAWSHLKVVGQVQHFSRCQAMETSSSSSSNLNDVEEETKGCDQLVFIPPSSSSSSSSSSSLSLKPMCEFHRGLELKRKQTRRMELVSSSSSSSFHFLPDYPLQGQGQGQGQASSSRMHAASSSLDLVWFGDQLLDPSSSSSLERKPQATSGSKWNSGLPPHQRRPFLKTTLHQCKSVGAQYLRKLHGVHENERLLHQDQQQQQQQQQQNYESTLASLMNSRFIHAAPSSSSSMVTTHPSSSSSSSSSSSLRDHDSDSDSLEILDHDE